MAPKRVALLAGCRYAILPNKNYKGKSHELKGCVNDVKNVRDELISRFGFEESNITVLTEEGNLASSHPIGVNIKEKLLKMAGDSKPRDLLLFYFSGHGTRFCFKNDPTREMHEAIVPSDFNLITKFDFRLVLNKLKKSRATFVFLSDSCHSGGLLDILKLQIRDVESDETHESTQQRELPDVKFRMIEYEELQEVLGTEDVPQFLKSEFHLNASVCFEKDKGNLQEVKEHKGILISACRPKEYASELGLLSSDHCSTYHGAFTFALLSVLRENRGRLSNMELVKKVRKRVGKYIKHQHPCLYCSDQNLNDTFLLQENNIWATREIKEPSLDLDLGLLDEIKQTAEVYFLKSSGSTQEKIKIWFNKLDLDHDNKVKAKDVCEILGKKKGCDTETLCKFINSIIGWDILLDLNQVLALYYTSRSLVKFCRKCGKFLKSFYFTCIDCFTTENLEFNICPQCLQVGVQCPLSGHGDFLDNHALLRFYHLKELKSSKSVDHPEKPSPQDINKHLEEAETLFRNGTHLDEAVKGLPSSKKFNLDVALTTDICSIM